MGRKSGILSVIIVFTMFVVTTLAEKVLIYDEERGIMYVEKDSLNAIEKRAAPNRQSKPPESSRKVAKHPADIHRNRPKDPPELYFNSGLEYFKNKDYRNALKNFTFADSAGHKPQYKLWVGKSLRQLGQYQEMLEVMQSILDDNAESDIADDALFEIAMFHQKTNDYARAIELYTKLAEQYPFGRSFSNGDEFLEISGEQRKYMRAEQANLLSILGYSGDNLEARLLAFQNDHQMPQTGVGNRETIQKLKQLHQEHVTKEALREKREKQKKYIVQWSTVTGAAGIFNLIVMIVVQFRARSKKRYIAILSQTLADLDCSKLKQSMQ